ncbi:MAG: hypothetical protein H0T73_16265 [Ardenticatenales bacterium]|nr:hypothetical protein [Ardenticatenales bacterium]
MAPEPFLRVLHQATQQMMANTEPLLTVERATLDPIFTRFYDEVFPTLFGTTERMVGSQSLLTAANWVDTYPVADAEFTPDAQGTLEDLRCWLFDDKQG